MNDRQLLREFAERGSEGAFRALVDAHLPLVFGTARRITRNPALAEEVAQTVFILLARKAAGFASGVILSGWLFRTTRFVAARALRAENRRRKREEEALIMQQHTESNPLWTRVEPHLDQALSRLSEPDRNALLLRFFEQRSFREVALALGIHEEAAKKRVARAIEPHTAYHRSGRQPGPYGRRNRASLENARSPQTMK
jgi:RNA polymerase sigma factor (sigma-70 family)